MSPDSFLLRSFIAIPLQNQQQQQIAQLQQQLRPLLPEAKFGKAENLHLTLHFLGEQPQELLAEIGRTMLSIGEKKKNFNVTLKCLGFFPNRCQPRILWLGIEPPDRLLQLYQQLGRQLRRLEVKADNRAYQPHLTLARFRRPPQNIELLCPFLTHSCGRLNIDRMVLYTSRLTAQGAVHMPLVTAPLSLKDL